MDFGHMFGNQSKCLHFSEFFLTSILVILTSGWHSAFSGQLWQSVYLAPTLLYTYRIINQWKHTYVRILHNQIFEKKELTVTTAALERLRFNFLVFTFCTILSRCLAGYARWNLNIWCPGNSAKFHFFRFNNMKTFNIKSLLRVKKSKGWWKVVGKELVPGVLLRSNTVGVQVSEENMRHGALLSCCSEVGCRARPSTVLLAGLLQ